MPNNDKKDIKKYIEFIKSNQDKFIQKLDIDDYESKDYKGATSEGINIRMNDLEDLRLAFIDKKKHDISVLEKMEISNLYTSNDLILQNQKINFDSNLVKEVDEIIKTKNKNRAFGIGLLYYIIFPGFLLKILDIFSPEYNSMNVKTKILILVITTIVSVLGKIFSYVANYVVHKKK